MSYLDIKQALRQVATPDRARSSAWFFKSGTGQYGEGDKFLGVSVPDQRKISKQFYKDLTIADTIKLLKSPWHEERLTAAFILVLKYQKESDLRQQIYTAYLANTKWINNWDIVDSSAEFIVGPWLDGRPDKMKILTKLAKSDQLWERRIAMLATFYDIKQGRADSALKIGELLLHDQHDLIQKAVGWMLRELGKKVDRKLLTQFLDKHAATMPRTTLRYAIEHFDPIKRTHYLGLKHAA